MSLLSFVPKRSFFFCSILYSFLSLSGLRVSLVTQHNCHQPLPMGCMPTNLKLSQHAWKKKGPNDGNRHLSPGFLFFFLLVY